MQFVLERRVGVVGVVGAFWRHSAGPMDGCGEIQTRWGLVRSVRGVVEESRCLVMRCPSTGGQREENKMTAKGPSVVNDVGVSRSGSALAFAFVPLPSSFPCIRPPSSKFHTRRAKMCVRACWQRAPATRPLLLPRPALALM